MKMTKNIRCGVLAMVIGFGLALVSCEQESSVSENVEPAELVTGGESVATGQFEGRSDHIVTGAVEIVEKDGKFIVNLGSDFSLDGAPDPKVGLGKNGYVKSTKAGPLQAHTGASSYELPAGVNPGDYNEVYIWCEKFDVPLGVAKLTSK